MSALYHLNKKLLGILILVLVSIFIWPNQATAEIMLPDTPCDTAVDNFSKLMPGSPQEDGNTAFTYGSDSGDFVSAGDGAVAMHFQILFDPGVHATVKLWGLTEACGATLGYAFGNFNLEGENVLTYDPVNYTISFNDQTTGLVEFGLTRYLWMEVVNQYPSPTVGSYSYVVDVQNPQNPGGEVTMRPVIIVPGILGTTLFNGQGEFIWPDLLRMVVSNNDNFLSEELLLSEHGDSLKPVNTGGVVKFIEIGFSRFELDTFKSLEVALEGNGYMDDSNLFYLPYDWRLDLATSKERLKQKIDTVKIQTGSDKVDIVAHSMGGLLVKSYISDYGSDSVDKLIFVGTPHLGAPKAGKVLLAGDRFGIPWLEEDRMRDLALNSPALYELLPDSQYFENFQGYIKKFSFLENPSLLNSEQTKEFLATENGKNSLLIDTAETFKNSIRDVDYGEISVYNIAGCRIDTQAAYSLGVFGNIGHIGRTTGDGTVPLISADFVNTAPGRKFYVRNVDHSELPSSLGTKELITSILKNEPVTLPENISYSNSFCNYKGKTLTWRSPVEVHIYDVFGNHTGPIENNAIEYGIPGVGYDVIDGEKFIFLSTGDGQVYDIQAIGEASGTFDLLVSKTDNGIEGETYVFNNVPIDRGSFVEFDISNDIDDTHIVLDGESKPYTSYLENFEDGDLLPPEIVIFYNEDKDMLDFQAIDNLDPTPVITCSQYSCLASDNAGNDTLVQFDRFSSLNENKVSLARISYNQGDYIPFPNNLLNVQFVDPQQHLQAFGQLFIIKSDELVKVNYKKIDDLSEVIRKATGEKIIKEISRGIKHLEIETMGGELKINIK